MKTAFRNLKRLPFTTVLAAHRYGLNNISVPVSAKLGAKLCMAILRGDNLEVKKLIAGGASLNYQDTPDGWTPLIYSIYYNNPHALKLLLELKADINRTDFSGRTPLMIAAIRDDQELITILLRLGADASAIDSKGKSALDFAVEYQSQQSIRLLSSYSN